MAALTANRKGTFQDGDRACPDEQSFPVAAGVHIFAGAIVVVVGGVGNAQPATTATGLIVVGVAMSEADNTAGAAGAITVRVKRGSFTFDSGTSADTITFANAGVDCYVSDDHTVNLTSASSARSRAGKIMGVDLRGVHVLMGIGF